MTRPTPDRYVRTVTVRHQPSCPAVGYVLGAGDSHRCECGATNDAFERAYSLRRQNLTPRMVELDPKLGTPMREAPQG
jgi:hypothetical protein